MTPFALATAVVDGAPVAALRIEGTIYPLGRLAPGFDGVSVRGLLQRWPSAFDELSALVDQVVANPPDERVGALDEPHLLSPVQLPDKLLAVGANYIGHLKAMGLKAEKWTPMPFFARPVANTLVGPGPTVRIPANTQAFDWECEMTIVVGRRLRDASQEEALAGVAGYMVGLDMTCRDLIQVDNELKVDLARGKSQDTMCPCGPWLTPAAFAGDIENLPIRLRVNGEVMMDDSTSDMLFSVPEMLSEISHSMTLEPGDMLLTGSPDGSAGQHDDRWLRPGDVISADIGDLGPLEVTMIAP